MNLVQDGIYQKGMEKKEKKKKKKAYDKKRKKGKAYVEIVGLG